MLALLGDLHGAPQALRRTYRMIQDEPNIPAVIQVGDFGWYREIIRLEWDRTYFEKPTYFIGGNHEEWELLKHITVVTELLPNLFFIPNGTTLELDGKKILFMGGASSVDKAIRLRQGMHWSVGENITPEELARVDRNAKIDLMITHTAPQSMVQKHMNPMDLVNYFGLPSTWADPDSFIVEDLWTHFGKPMLFCGHFHKSVIDEKFRILDINEILAYEPTSNA